MTAINLDELRAQCEHAGARFIHTLDLNPHNGPRTEMVGALYVWTGIDETGGDGSDWIERCVDEFHITPDPRFGEWPYAVETFVSHDPKDNPDGMSRWFLTMRLRRIEGEFWLGFYMTRDDAVADTTADYNPVGAV